MTHISVALIDNDPFGHEFIRKCIESQDALLEAARSPNVGLVLDEGISQVASMETVDSITAAIANHTGPLLLFVDLDLSFEDATKLDLINRLSEALSLNTNVARIRAIQFLTNLKQSAALRRYVDGIEFAWKALANEAINPLFIQFASNEPAVIGDWTRMMYLLAEGLRSPECFKVGEARGGLSFGAAFASVMNPGFALRGIIMPVAEDLLGIVGICSGDPMAGLRKFLDWAGTPRLHDQIDDAVAGGSLADFLRSPMNHLLGKEGVWDYIWPFIQEPRIWGEIIKRCGTGSREQLTAAGAWLLALAAFHAANNQRDWLEIFKPAHLAISDDGWDSFRLSPALTIGLHDSPNTLRDAIERYFRMCYELFRPQSRQMTGPLEGVTLSEKGLELDLNFDAWTSRSGKPCLAQQLGRWRDGYLQGRSGNSWTLPLGSGSGASRAILDWWLASSLGDYRPMLFNDLFGFENLWTLRLRRTPRGNTKVIFCG